MPIVNRIADYHDEMKEWRQHIHKNPELNFDCHKTADFVIKKCSDRFVQNSQRQFPHKMAKVNFHTERRKNMQHMCKHL